MASTKTTTYKKGTPLVVTTAHRGVFFGYFAAVTEDHKRITLTKARNCLYWTSTLHGFIGLATTGPNSKCRVGPAADQLELLDVTAIMQCSNDAVEAWEKAPWS